jgi:NADH-quinone oxidoreductase subunit K
MTIAWYLAVSALVFAIGAAGVLVRRNPMWGNADGQVFALIVVVVAACEVVIGLGLIVAMYRRHVPVDVDEMRELQG